MEYLKQSEYFKNLDFVQRIRHRSPYYFFQLHKMEYMGIVAYFMNSNSSYVTEKVKAQNFCKTGFA